MKIKTKKFTDEECMDLFIELLKTRVAVNTGFVMDKENGNITHQVIQITCGELKSVSEPQPLKEVLRVATGSEQGATVN